MKWWKLVLKAVCYKKVTAWRSWVNIIIGCKFYNKGGKTDTLEIFRVCFLISGPSAITARRHALISTPLCPTTNNVTKIFKYLSKTMEFRNSPIFIILNFFVLTSSLTFILEFHFNPYAVGILNSIWLNLNPSKSLIECILSRKIVITILVKIIFWLRIIIWRLNENLDN